MTGGKTRNSISEIRNKFEDSKFEGSKLVVLALLAMAGLGWCLESPQAAFAIENERLLARQRSQERARRMAAELVGGILDVQLRQLEENGMTGLPIYGEIRDMRGSLHALVEEEMQEVVVLLTQAQEAEGDTRNQAFAQARDKIRQVVIKITAERQKLMLRMRVARLAAQTRQVIELQERTRRVTERLDSLPGDDRETQALSNIEDQKDVRAVYFQLIESLHLATGLGGQVGAGAVQGLAILKVAQVKEAIEEARKNIAHARFTDATERQTHVLQGLRRLLEQVEKTHGLISSDPDAILRRVRELMEQQEKLRDVTRKEELSFERIEPLVREQSKLHQELGELARELADRPMAQPPLEQAKEASFEAAGEIFDQRQEEAVREQDEVIGALAEVERRLQEDSAGDRGGMTAEELAIQAQALEKAKEQLAAAQQPQTAAEEAAADNPAQAQRKEIAVAEALKDVPNENLPKAANVRVEEAQRKAAAAAEKLNEARSAEQAPQREAAVEAAGEALDQAQAEVEAQLADKKREALAVKAGELSRASEALERAAAAERRLGAEAAQAADEGTAQEHAEEFARDQADVAEVAENIAKGVEETAPAAAETLKPAAETAREGAEALRAAQQKAAENAAAASQEAQQAVEQVAAAAEPTARQLDEAARQLRQAAGKAAEQLAQIAAEQARQARQLGEEIEQASAAAHRNDAAARMERLAQAAQAINEARVAQQRAAKTADQNAQQAAQQTPGTPTAIAQKEVTEKAEQAAEQVARAMRNAAVEQGEQLARQAGEAERLAQRAAEIDPSAAAALRQAQKASERGAQAAPEGQPGSQGQQSLREARHQAAEVAKATADARRGLERAQAAIAARQDRLERDQATAEAIARLAQEQQSARDELAQAAESLRRQGQGPQDQSAQGQSPQGQGPEQAARSLQQATRRFAQTQRATGEGAAEISQQQEVANADIRRGLEAAARLAPNQQAPQTPSSSDTPALSPGRAIPPQGPPTPMGTGFVPESPEATAEAIAGAEAMQMAAQMMAAVSGGQGMDPTPSMPRPRNYDSRAGGSAHEQAVKPREFKKAPWFAKLPPELQKAIQAKGRQRPPKGYEERLQRYFESTEK